MSVKPADAFEGFITEELTEPGARIRTQYVEKSVPHESQHAYARKARHGLSAKSAITKAHKVESKKEDPDTLVGGRQKMREAVLQLSLFPNLYNRHTLMTSM